MEWHGNEPSFSEDLNNKCSAAVYICTRLTKRGTERVRESGKRRQQAKTSLNRRIFRNIHGRN